MRRQYAEYNDAKLVEVIRSGKPQSDYAFSELYSRYSTVIHTYCRYMAPDKETADDVFQETFIRFYKSLAKEYSADNVGGYLFRVARNLCINLQRDKKSIVPLAENILVHEPYAQYEREEMAGLVKAAVELLDDKYREAFVLREIDNLPYNEIAEMLDITVSGAKSRVIRAKEKLIDLLEPYLKEIT